MPSSALPVQIINPNSNTSQDVGLPSLQDTQDFTSTPFSATSGGGDVVILAAPPAGKTTRVHSIRFTVNTAGKYAIKMGATTVETFAFYGPGSIVLDFRGRPYYVGTGALSASFDNTGQTIIGVVEYVQK